jgi:hypothetical protein
VDLPAAQNVGLVPFEVRLPPLEIERDAKNYVMTPRWTITEVPTGGRRFDYNAHWYVKMRDEVRSRFCAAVGLRHDDVIMNEFNAGDFRMWWLMSNRPVPPPPKEIDWTAINIDGPMPQGRIADGSVQEVSAEIVDVKFPKDRVKAKPTSTSQITVDV